MEGTNRFKGLDLISRVPEELWTEARDIVQEAGIKTIRKKKKCKKAKLLSKEVLQIAEERREAKGKGEKERSIPLNAEFQKIARRQKKAFLGDQCKDIEGNNRMGKTRDLFKKTGDTKRNFMQNGHNKGQKCYRPIRSRRYEEEYRIYSVARRTIQKKILHDPNNHDGGITHLEPDIPWNVKSSGP